MVAPNRMAAFVAGAIVCPAVAVPPPAIDWDGVPLTRHADFQAVNPDGSPAYTDGFPLRLRGVLLATPGQVFDNSSEIVPVNWPFTAFQFGGRQQPYVQASSLVDPTDAGGTAMFLAQSLGNHPANQDDAFTYSESEWLAELDRLNSDPATGRPFRAGDLVEIRARIGLHFSGKFNVNEAHNNSPSNDFDLVLITPDVGLPEPTPIQIASVKDAANADIFDPARQTGGERYQSTRVTLTYAVPTDPAAWAPGEIVTLEADGRTIPLVLGTDPVFAAAVPSFFPGAPLTITGIFDQEASPAPVGGANGYRLIAVESGEVRLASDVDGDGVFTFRDAIRFLAAFDAGDAEADLALTPGDPAVGQPGTLDEADVLRFLAAASLSG